MPIGAKERRAFDSKIKQVMKKAKTLDKTTVSGAMGLLRELRRDVKSMIATAEGWDAAYLPRLKAEIALRMGDFRNRLGDYMNNQETESWNLGIEIADAPLEAAKISTALPLLSDELLVVAQNYTADLITGLEDDMRKQVNTQLNNAILGKQTPWKTMKKIDSEVFKYKEKAGVTWKTERIVRTEVNRVYAISNQARMEQAAEQVPELRKHWLTAGDERVRRAKIVRGRVYDHAAAHCQVVPVNEPFMVSGEPLMYPRDPSGSAPNVVSCRCISVPEVV